MSLKIESRKVKLDLKGTYINRMEPLSPENVPLKKKRKILEISKHKIKNRKTTDAINKKEPSVSREEGNLEANDKSVNAICENSYDTTLDVEVDKSFSVLNNRVSEETLSAIKDMNLTHMTEIQAKSIPHLLKGRNLIGAAKTGSGKTLAFLIPMVELMHKLKYEERNGTGCIIICPTRELAIQTLKVLEDLLKYHHFTYNLLIGGANKKAEIKKLKTGSTIIVATPGRLLDHMENTTNFIYRNLWCLVIDEADIILDIGAGEDMKRILKKLPENRQTVLYSATVTKKTIPLIKLAFNKKAIYVGVDDDKDEATVEGLEQGYMICPSEKRLLLLFTFLKMHKMKKNIVFFSSCSSAKYHCEVLNHMDISVMSIHGKQKQGTRSSTFTSFCKAEFGTLLCTDVAARGLDIPNVDYILQFDPPDNPSQYIHRVGRTARAGGKGKALLFLRPEECEFRFHLRKARVLLNKHEFNENLKTVYENVQPTLEKLISTDWRFRELAKEAYKAYIRAFTARSLKDIFNIETLDLTSVAKSFGFTKPPVELNLKVGKKAKQLRK